MKTNRLLIAALLGLCLQIAVAGTPAQLPDFVYQGRLEQAGVLANGTFDLEFRLWDDATAGTQVGDSIIEADYPVVNGIFSINLSFPGAFTGSQLYLETTVDGVTLPRQPISTAPVAQWALAGNLGAYAGFHALMPPDNFATVAPGSAVDFPQDGETFGGIVRVSAGSFLLPSAGVYKIMFHVSVDEPGQLVLALDDVELQQTVVGRATGTSQIVGSTLLRATAGQVLSVRNPSGNPTALTITPLAGGTQPVSAHLSIIRLGD